jgi:hypothetical protein
MRVMNKEVAKMNKTKILFIESEFWELVIKILMRQHPLKQLKKEQINVLHHIKLSIQPCVPMTLILWPLL